MTALSLAVALRLAEAVLASAATRGLAPLCVVVLDAGSHDLVLLRSERAAFYRGEIARAKAKGCLGMGIGGRGLAERAKVAPAFYAALGSVASGGILPIPGGVLLRDAAGTLLGAIGVSGDTADNDEAAALDGIAAVALVADTGA